MSAGRTFEAGGALRGRQGDVIVAVELYSCQKEGW